MIVIPALAPAPSQQKAGAATRNYSAARPGQRAPISLCLLFILHGKRRSVNLAMCLVLSTYTDLRSKQNRIKLAIPCAW